MNCSDYETLIALYVEDDLSLSAKEDLEAHLQNCATCRVFLANLRKTQSILKDLGGDVLDPNSFSTVRERVMAQVSRQVVRRSSRWLSLSAFWRWQPAAAAAMVLLVCLAILWQWHLFRKSVGRRHSSESNGASVTSAQPQQKPLSNDSQPSEHTPRVPGKQLRTTTAQLARVRVPVPLQTTVFQSETVTETASAENPAENEQGAILEAEVPPAVDVPSEKPDPLVIKLLTDDPNIVIVWLVDEDVNQD
jgi:hypothetical protein